MKIAIKNYELAQNYPDEDEIRQAVKVCCGRCCVACETPVEYAWRKRETDLAFMLDAAIENELTETEREVIRDYYFSGTNCAAIARKRGVAAASVKATRKRAEQKLRQALKYLYMYMRDRPETGENEVCLDNGFSILAAKKGAPGDISGRIRALRVKRGLSGKKASEFLGIPLPRLTELESGGGLPDAEEIKKICSVYSVSFDELLAN